MNLDDEVMCALINQVSKAVPEGGSERDVLTLITVPMWEMWSRAVNFPAGACPPIHSVYGSLTVLVASDRIESGSIALQR